MSWTVTSDNLAGHELGSTVSEEDMAGLNVDALVAGGHLAPGSKSRKPATTESEA